MEYHRVNTKSKAISELIEKEGENSIYFIVDDGRQWKNIEYCIDSMPNFQTEHVTEFANTFSENISNKFIAS